MSVKVSWVWDHFSNPTKDSATCIHCRSQILRKDGVTSALINHLSSKHNIKKQSDDTEPESKRRKVETRSMLDFVKRESLGEILAKCAAKDGFSIQKMVDSDAIKGYLRTKQFKMPKSPATVWNNAVLKMFTRSWTVQSLIF